MPNIPNQHHESNQLINSANQSSSNNPNNNNPNEDTA